MISSWKAAGRRHFIVLLMGFSSGLPLLLIGGTLRAWMKESGVDLTLIGLFAFVGLPYTLKFLWAPFVDRYNLLGLGRRRGWMFVAQAGLVLSLLAMASVDPLLHPWHMAIAAFVVAFFSASQDIVIDAYRREYLPDTELGLGTSMTMTGYRLALLVAGALALILADQIPWNLVYICMAVFMLVGVFTTLFSPEPSVGVALPKTWKESIVDPFADYFQRRDAIVILVFILLYKVGDSMASDMLNPFYLDIGFSKSQIGLIAKPIGLWATIVGGITGGVLMIKMGLWRSLWLFGFLQALSTALFAGLASAGAHLWLLGVVIFFETFSGGMGSAAYGAFMLSLTNKKFSATQYALLSSLMGVPRIFFGASTGWLAKTLGWDGFFILCTLAAIPGMIVLFRFRTWMRER